MSRNQVHRWISPKVLDAAILKSVDDVALVDTHEHLDEEEVRLKQPNDLMRWFLYYTFSEVATAGIPDDRQKRFFAQGIGADEQWDIVKAAWPGARLTGSGIAVRLGLKELYGIEDLRDDTLRPLLERTAKRNKPGVLEWILKEKCNIDCCLVNAGDPGDLSRRTKHPGLFLFDLAVSSFCDNSLDVSRHVKTTGLACHSLADWKKIIDWYFTRWGNQVVALKNVCAYWRPLYFEDVSEAKAGPLFEKWALKKKKVTQAERKAVQDFNFHYCIRKAREYRLPVKIHTGYHSGQDYTDPSLYQVNDLCNLFRQYPDVRFDLFHIGYPEWTDTINLAKHYTNVFGDMCWAWIIDPHASLEFLRQALGAVPLSKIFAFGGDYGYADMVYGHQRMARDGVALVLTEAFRQGRISRSDAQFAARRWLRENAMEVFRVTAKRTLQKQGQPQPLRP
jgi:hypothetical protein